MRHRQRGRRFSRTTSHREALLRNMATALFREEKIRTTLSKAKELRSYAEKLITKARHGGLHNRRQALREIQDRTIVAKLFDELGARYANRPGGYTRIIRAGFRRGDGAAMAFLELVESELPKTKAPPLPREEEQEIEDADAKDSAAESIETAAMPVEALGLPTRLTTILEEAGIETIEDLATKSEDELLSLSGVGEKSLEQIREALETRDRRKKE